jgi:hypothetical protein
LRAVQDPHVFRIALHRFWKGYEVGASDGLQWTGTSG